MQWLFLIVAGIVLLALLSLVRGIHHLRRGRPVRGSMASLTAVVLVVICALAIGFGVNLGTYQRLTAEQAVAMLHFYRLGPQNFRAIIEESGDGTRSVELRGDAWQLDARVIKWKGLAAMLGLDPLYRLDRISGRYANVEQDRSAPRTVEALSAEPGLDLWQWAQNYSRWLPWVDATYGSATYLPMADRAEYRVSITASGLVARPDNEAARMAVEAWK